MLNVEIRNSLANIIRQNGKRIAQDPVGLQTLLRAEASQYPREIGMIVNAARAGIPQDIENAGNAIYDLRPRMIEKLQNEQAFPADVAEWVVETWISALSVAEAGAPVEAPAPVQPVAPVAPEPPAAPMQPPAPVAPAPVAQPAPPMAGPAQPPYGAPPQANPYQPQQPQYGQFPQQKSGGSGKMVAIIALIVVVLGGLGAGTYFLFFKGKGGTPTPTSGPIIANNTNGGTNGGPPPNQQDLFGNNAGGPGTNAGGPGTTGGGPGTDGGNPGTNGGGPGTNGGGPGTDGGNPGTNGGGQPTAGGTYHVEYDPAEQDSGTGSLTLNPDMTFTLEIAAGGTTIDESGKMVNGGNQIVLNGEKLSVNGKDAPDPTAMKMSLVPVDANKFLCQGTLPDSIAQAAPGTKMYFVK